MRNALWLSLLLAGPAAAAGPTDGSLVAPPEAQYQVATASDTLHCKGDIPKSCPKFRAPECINGWWACTARAACPPRPDWKPPEGMRLACLRGEWTFVKRCDAAKKPTCIASQRAACRDGAWACIADTCLGAKPTCGKGDRVVCREDRWSCVAAKDHGGKVCPEIAPVCAGGAKPVKGPDGCFDRCPKTDDPPRRWKARRDRKGAVQGSSGSEGS